MAVIDKTKETDEPDAGVAFAALQSQLTDLRRDFEALRGESVNTAPVTALEDGLLAAADLFQSMHSSCFKQATVELIKQVTGAAAVIRIRRAGRVEGKAA